MHRRWRRCAAFASLLPWVAPRHEYLRRGLNAIRSAPRMGHRGDLRRAPTVDNRVARNRYDYLETHECGVELLGTEIKAVREGKMNIRQGYARVKNGELFLHNVHISHWSGASKFFNHDPLRERKLLLHKRIIRKLAVQQKDPGLTLVPAKAYFNNRGYLKLEIALARGKKLHDKREDIKKRDADRDIRRIIKSTLAA